MDPSTGETLPSSASTLALSSGEPTPELGGDVLGVPRSHSFADHEFGDKAPGLTVDAIECELGKDRLRWVRTEGAADPDCCEWRELLMVCAYRPSVRCRDVQLGSGRVFFCWKAVIQHGSLCENGSVREAHFGRG